jgi:hypothetical protein
MRDVVKRLRGLVEAGPSGSKIEASNLISELRDKFLPKTEKKIRDLASAAYEVRNRVRDMRSKLPKDGSGVLMDEQTWIMLHGHLEASQSLLEKAADGMRQALKAADAAFGIKR